jgi:hypothetical protein
MNQRERQTVKSCRLTAESVRENAAWWERQGMPGPAAKAHLIADRAEARAAAIEAGAITLAVQEAA